MNINQQQALYEKFILIADHDPDELEGVLYDEGYQQLKLVKSEKEAQNILNAQRVDLLICNLKSARISGMQLLNEIKRNPQLNHIPVLMVGDTVNHREVLRCIRDGAVDFLGKPVDESMLLARVQRILLDSEIQEAHKKELNQAQTELERANSLLYNVMPQRIVKKMHQESPPIAEYVSDVSMLFADMVGFTEFTSHQNPRQLVSILNEIFLYFDHLADDFQLEKIKTIGDNYMLCGGLEKNTKNHPEKCVRFAKSAIKGLHQFEQTYELGVSLRIGICSGPVVAGIIGNKRLMFDVWGETVNMASRMESTGLPDRIQVTSETFERLPASLGFENRGMIDVKGQGLMETFISPEYLETFKQ